MNYPQKCAHAACECFLAAKGPYGKYCSEECKSAGQIAELHCNCQHVECRTHTYRSSDTAVVRPRAT
jgi:hypothetical protein